MKTFSLFLAAFVVATVVAAQTPPARLGADVGTGDADKSYAGRVNPLLFEDAGKPEAKPCAKRATKRAKAKARKPAADQDLERNLWVGPKPSASPPSAPAQGAGDRSMAERTGDYGHNGNVFFIRADIVSAECGTGTPQFTCSLPEMNAPEHRCGGGACRDRGDNGWKYHPMRRDGEFWVADCLFTAGMRCNVAVGAQYFPDHRHVGWQGVIAHNPERPDTGAWLVLP